MKSKDAFLVTNIPEFVANGLRRCAVPGIGCTFMGSPSVSSNADFWCGKNGAVLMRITCMGYRWSFRAQRRSGRPIPNEREPMEAFAEFVLQELHRWMSEDAADMPPFDDEEAV